MKYTEGSIGRMFVVKFEHGDDFLAELNNLVKKENIRSGIIQFMGALNSTEMVVGPEKNTLPPIPVWKNFDDGREVIGTGMIFWNREGPKIHLHASIGRGDNVNVGCLRKDADVYVIIEAVIFEINGVQAHRAMDEATGLELLEVE